MSFATGGVPVRHGQFCTPRFGVRPCTLEGPRVRLEPLTLAHQAPLCAVGLDEDLWRWSIFSVLTPDAMRAYIECALREQAEGTALPFAVVARAAGQIVGSTRFHEIEPAHRRLEIGHTWVARPHQGTGVNTEAKYLMLRHAFETLGCVRVQFKVDPLNDRSRRAVLGLGAREEGTFRNYQITPAGRVRDLAYYSVIDSEWPAVKARLEAKLGWPAPPDGGRAGAG